jgi:hypothetical protein
MLVSFEVVRQNAILLYFLYVSHATDSPGMGGSSASASTEAFQLSFLPGWQSAREQFFRSAKFWETSNIGLGPTAIELPRIFHYALGYTVAAIAFLVSLNSSLELNVLPIHIVSEIVRKG